MQRLSLVIFLVTLLFIPLVGFTATATVQPSTAHHNKLSTSTSSSSNKPRPAPVIMVLGDSLSAGYGIEQDKGWVNLLQQRLHAKHYPYRVINASISGETTQGGSSRIAQLLDQYRPRIVLVELGGNDGLRGLPIKTMRASLEQIIKTIRARSIRCVLIGMRLPPNYGLQYTRDFARVYQDLAKHYRLPLVPFLMQGFATNFQLIQDDGIHPTAKAQPLMLHNVWPILFPLL